MTHFHAFLDEFRPPLVLRVSLRAAAPVLVQLGLSARDLTRVGRLVRTDLRLDPRHQRQVLALVHKGKDWGGWGGVGGGDQSDRV